MKLALAWVMFCAVVWLAIHTEPERQSEISAAYWDITSIHTRGNDVHRAGEPRFDDLGLGYAFPLYRHFTLSESDIVELRMLYREQVTATLATSDVFTAANIHGADW